MKLLPHAIANALRNLSTVFAPWPGWLAVVELPTKTKAHSEREPRHWAGALLVPAASEPARRAGMSQNKGRI